MLNENQKIAAMDHRIIKPGQGRYANLDAGLIQLRDELKMIEKKLRREKWKHYFRHPIKALTNIYMVIVGLFSKKAKNDYGWSDTTYTTKNDDGTTTIEYRDMKGRLIRKETLYLTDESEEKREERLNKEEIEKPLDTKTEIRKKKMRAAYDLALIMQSKGFLNRDLDALDKQVDEMMKFDDAAFESYKRAVMGTSFQFSGPLTAGSLQQAKEVLEKKSEELNKSDKKE